jgi:SsrA-binding protein
LAKKTPKKPGEHREIIARNKQAKRNFEIESELEVGLVLQGPEVKSLRQGQASITEAYCRLVRGEVWLVGCNIPEYKNAGYAIQDPIRDRKCLLHRREIEKLSKKVIERGFTLIPMELYWKGANVKLQMGLGKGKKLFDKRQDNAERDSKRDIARMLKDRG